MFEFILGKPELCGDTLLIDDQSNFMGPLDTWIMFWSVIMVMIPDLLSKLLKAGMAGIGMPCSKEKNQVGCLVHIDTEKHSGCARAGEATDEDAWELELGKTAVITELDAEGNFKLKIKTTGKVSEEWLDPQHFRYYPRHNSKVIYKTIPFKPGDLMEVDEESEKSFGGMHWPKIEKWPDDSVLHDRQKALFLLGIHTEARQGRPYEDQVTKIEKKSVIEKLVEETREEENKKNGKGKDEDKGKTVGIIEENDYVCMEGDYTDLLQKKSGAVEIQILKEVKVTEQLTEKSAIHISEMVNMIIQILVVWFTLLQLYVKLHGLRSVQSHHCRFVLLASASLYGPLTFAVANLATTITDKLIFTVLDTKGYWDKIKYRFVILITALLVLANVLCLVVGFPLVLVSIPGWFAYIYVVFLVCIPQMVSCLMIWAVGSVVNCSKKCCNSSRAVAGALLVLRVLKHMAPAFVVYTFQMINFFALAGWSLYFTGDYKAALDALFGPIVDLSWPSFILTFNVPVWWATFIKLAQFDFSLPVFLANGFSVFSAVVTAILNFLISVFKKIMGCIRKGEKFDPRVKKGK
mmetsp:Transcript_73244/g.145272  ORF Transcript_73244/g.145272 Transcript_73244/m.145272 type:complete len:577 (+) Transcript_73244:580-2310(+)